jgi:hypothetical protein
MCALLSVLPSGMLVPTYQITQCPDSGNRNVKLHRRRASSHTQDLLEYLKIAAKILVEERWTCMKFLFPRTGLEPRALVILFTCVTADVTHNFNTTQLADFCLQIEILNKVVE